MYEQDYTQEQVDEMVAKMEATKAKNQHHFANDFDIKEDDTCDVFRLIEQGLPEEEAIHDVLEGIDEYCTEHPFE